MSSDTRHIFISADHGLAIVYFLQTDVVPRLVEKGFEVVVLTADSLIDRVRERFGGPGIHVEGLRLDAAQDYASRSLPELQWWLSFLRRVGGSSAINTGAMDSYVEQVIVEQSNWRRMWMPLALIGIGLLRRSSWARRMLVRIQQAFQPNLYADLFEKYAPQLVVGSTPGWRLDRYLLREAYARGVRNASVIVGWDNPSSYSVPGARVDAITCWSIIQERELVDGSDWQPEQVNIGGMPLYDGYLSGHWALAREEYRARHDLDDERKLLAYACSFVSFAPNLPNVQALTSLVTGSDLDHDCQLLVRLHPNHFLEVPLFERERLQIEELAERHEHVHLVAPIALGEALGHYSGEDMDEKASMLTHADVFLTVYSTMVVEAAVHDRPIISVCIDTPGGWNWPRKYSLPLSKIGDWPTHQRFRESGAGRVAFTERELREAINHYLMDPMDGSEARRAFVEQEITIVDGTAGRRTADYLIGLAEAESA